MTATVNTPDLDFITDAIATQPVPTPAHPNVDIPRDRYGRPLVWADKKAKKPTAYTRATTLAATLSDKFALEQWKIRTAISGLIARPDLLQLAATHLDDKQTLNKVAAEAVTAGDTKKAAAHGTSLHRWCEMADRGETLDQFGDLAPLAHIDAWREGFARHGLTIEPDHIERFCVCEPVHAAGTYDRAVTLPDGRVVIADLKTGGYLNHLEIAIQLAVYANATSLYTPTDSGGRHDPPHPDLDRTVGLILHLPQDDPHPTLKVYEVDLVEGWAAAQLAHTVRSLRNRQLATVVDPAWPSRTELERRIDVIKQYAAGQLSHYWPAGVPTFRQSDSHTPEQLATIDVALTRLESDHCVPF